MQFHRCPICHKPAEPATGNTVFPFCSERCKLIDLGSWLTGQYVVTSNTPFDQSGDDADDPDSGGD